MEKRSRGRDAARPPSEAVRAHGDDDESASPQHAPFFIGKPSGPRPAQPPQCPECRTRMGVKLVTPVLFASDVDDVTYVCKRCGTETRRTVRRS